MQRRASVGAARERRAVPPSMGRLQHRLAQAALRRRRHAAPERGGLGRRLRREFALKGVHIWWWGQLLRGLLFLLVLLFLLFLLSSRRLGWARGRRRHLGGAAGKTVTSTKETHRGGLGFAWRRGRRQPGGGGSRRCRAEIGGSSTRHGLAQCLGAVARATTMTIQTGRRRLQARLARRRWRWHTALGLSPTLGGR